MQQFLMLQPCCGARAWRRAWQEARTLMLVKDLIARLSRLAKSGGDPSIERSNVEQAAASFASPSMLDQFPPARPELKCARLGRSTND